MADVWIRLEERTRGWSALERQAVADAIWEDHVLARFAGRGDARALPHLIPYLRGGDRRQRLRALTIAARVFTGAGPSAIPALDWFTANADPFLRDRAVVVVAAAATGGPPMRVVELLTPFLASPNRFARRLALEGLAMACSGSADGAALAAAQRTADSLGEPLPAMVIAHIHAGRPDAAVWSLIAPGDVAAVGRLIRGAGREWFNRAHDEVLKPRLMAPTGPGQPDWSRSFDQRSILRALGEAGWGLGMAALAPALPFAGPRCTGHALLTAAQGMFDGADEDERGPLLDLLRTGAVPAQRIAALCLGRLMLGSADGVSLDALAGLLRAANGAVRAAALHGLGLVGRSQADPALMRVVMPHLDDGETAVAALRAIGLLALGTSLPGADAVVRDRLQGHRQGAAAGAHCRPLEAAHWALGLVHLGTGDEGVLEALLPSLALPDLPRHRPYRRAAAKALALVEHGELGLILAPAPTDRLLDDEACLHGPWTGILTSLET